jgi:S1-C subfamily serine protease
VVVAPDRLILTNSHVAGGTSAAARIAVTTTDARTCAPVSRRRSDTDLALIRIDEAVMPAAPPAIWGGSSAAN